LSPIASGEQFSEITSIEEMNVVLKEIVESNGLKVFDGLRALLNNLLQDIFNSMPSDLRNNVENNLYYKHDKKLDSAHIDLSKLLPVKIDFVDTTVLGVIKETQKIIKIDRKTIDFYMQPIVITQNFNSLNAELLKLFFCRTYYGKKDEQEFTRISTIYTNELKIHNLYSLERGIAALCRPKQSYTLDGEQKQTNHSFPSVPEIQEAIGYHHKQSLQLYANANWIAKFKN
jgi:hypothetical protein